MPAPTGEVITTGATATGRGMPRPSPRPTLTPLTGTATTTASHLTMADGATVAMPAPTGEVITTGATATGRGMPRPSLRPTLTPLTGTATTMASHLTTAAGATVAMPAPTGEVITTEATATGRGTLRPSPRLRPT